MIQDNEIPFTLKGGVATTVDISICNIIVSVLNTITLPGHAIQLLDVSLLDEAKDMGLSNILVEPDVAANIPYLSMSLLQEHLALCLIAIMQLFKS